MSTDQPADPNMPPLWVPRVLSFFVPGLGQLAAARYLKASVFFACVGLYGLCYEFGRGEQALPALALVWVWSLVDACNMTTEFQRYLSGRSFFEALAGIAAVALLGLQAYKGAEEYIDRQLHAKRLQELGQRHQEEIPDWLRPNMK